MSPALPRLVAVVVRGSERRAMRPARMEGTPMLWARVTGWRFWLVVGLVLLDGVVFVIPLIGTAAVVAALLAPDWLRRAADFLNALADGR